MKHYRQAVINKRWFLLLIDMHFTTTDDGCVCTTTLKKWEAEEMADLEKKISLEEC